MRGLHSDAAYLADHLKTIHGPIILVGHSYGGAVITTPPPATRTSTRSSTSPPSPRTRAKPASTSSPSSPAATPATTPTPPSRPPPTPFPSPSPTAAPAPTSTSSPRTAAMCSSATGSARPTPPNSPPPSAPWPHRPSASRLAPGLEDHPLLVPRRPRRPRHPPAAEEFTASRAHAQTTEVDAPHAAAPANPGSVTKLVEQAATAS
ncbi:alpha/beta fold hydrolase [Streptomyces sp. NPDC008222]|uniref:alpha/beta fold hydrolase n=1 Tax=Streptomyces sp. NPDC008222 TaxID=3364820 RepID=UPI0036EC834E